MLNDERPMLQDLLYIIKCNPDSKFLENVLTYAQNLERASARKQLVVNTFIKALFKGEGE